MLLLVRGFGQPRGACGTSSFGGRRWEGQQGVEARRGEGSGIPEEGSDITAEAFPQMRPCRAGLREHKEFVKSAALLTFKIKNGEEEISNSDRRRGKGRRQKPTEPSQEISSQPHSGLAPSEYTSSFFFFFFEHKLLYNVVLVSSVLQNESATHTHSSPLFQILFPVKSPWSTG